MDLYADLPPEDAKAVADMSRLLVELRDNRKILLGRYADEEAMLSAIAAGTQPEHPAYEACLGALTLDRSREQLREAIALFLKAHRWPEEPAAAVPAALKDAIAETYAGRLESPPVLAQDALMLYLENGAVMEVRYADAMQYSIRWLWGESEMGIDTAPVHKDLATFPNHLHDADGRAHADPLTVPGREPWDNVRAVLDAVIVDPLLGR